MSDQVLDTTVMHRRGVCDNKYLKFQGENQGEKIQTYYMLLIFAYLASKNLDSIRQNKKYENHPISGPKLALNVRQIHEFDQNSIKQPYLTPKLDFPAKRREAETSFHSRKAGTLGTL